MRNASRKEVMQPDFGGFEISKVTHDNVHPYYNEDFYEVKNLSDGKITKKRDYDDCFRFVHANG